MTKKIAFLFPGQGSQSVGMGKDLYENFESAKNVFDTADKVLGKSITTICFEGPEEDLKQTINTQPSIVTMSIAALEALKSQLSITPYCTAGHSLGEYCAMYASGVMNLETTLKAIQKRADLMGATKGGAMAAILNAPEGSLEKALKEASSVGYVDVANYNSPAQVVITGDEEAVKKAGELLSEAGARRVVPLAVSGAFHSKFMENAGHEFANFVSDLDLNNAEVSVFTNVDAQATFLSTEFKNKMPRQIYSSVHWTQTIEKMIAEGVDTFIEIGPGKVLAGLNKKIDANVKTYNIYDKESLESTVAALKEEMAIAKIRKEKFMKKLFVMSAIILSSFSMAYATVYEKTDQLEKAFYTNLQTCTVGDFQSRYNSGWYIYGQKNGKCSFENKSYVVDMKCLLPMNMAKKYAQEGLKLYKVSEQKGFAPGSDYINKINNDKNYCTMTLKHKK